MIQSRSRVDATGAAFKGSQRQVQTYVNKDPHVDTLNCAIATALGSEFGGEIDWVAPLQSRNYAEYHDSAFLQMLECGQLESALKNFWPSGGPRWDALARGQATKQVFLIEAKSYPAEMRSGGCHAGGDSLERILSSLRDTALWLHVNEGAPPESWTKDLYQSANRLAHLYFLRRHKIEAFLLNVCFVRDSHNPTELNDWRKALMQTKSELGLENHELPYVRDVFLLALP